MTDQDFSNLMAVVAMVGTVASIALGLWLIGKRR
jgi:hypothetical protein